MANEEKENKDKRKTQWLSNLMPLDFGFDIDPFRSTALAFRYPSKLSEYMWEGFSMPKVDVADNGDSFTVTADMPGVDKKHIKLTITESSITIRASKAQESESAGKNFYSKERSSVGYYRVVGMPERIREDSAKAKYENGTLRIDVRKLRPKEKGKEVRVD